MTLQLHFGLLISNELQPDFIIIFLLQWKKQMLSMHDIQEKTIFTNTYTQTKGPRPTWRGCLQCLASSLPPSCFCLLAFLQWFPQSPPLTLMPAQILASSDIQPPKDMLLCNGVEGHLTLRKMDSKHNSVDKTCFLKEYQSWRYLK